MLLSPLIHFNHENQLKFIFFYYCHKLIIVLNDIFELEWQYRRKKQRMKTKLFLEHLVGWNIVPDVHRKPQLNLQENEPL